MNTLLSCGASLALAASVCSAAAQTPGAPARANPLDANAATVPLVHRSPLAGYRRFDDAAPQAWREANQNVERIGGWRAYAREAHAPEPAASTPAPAASGLRR